MPKFIIKNFKLIICTAFLLSISSNTLAQEKRVLFLGNSYTAANNLPHLVSNLASSGGHTIYVDKNTPGGYTLAHPGNGHLYNSTSLGLIELGQWDYVVLQEQSQFPVIDYYRNNFTYPGSYELDSIIREKNECAQTMFYMTWGRKYGGEQCIDTSCSIPFTDYSHMQDSLASAYMNMSNGLNTPVSPVGIAWKKSIVEYSDPIELFASDGSHPSLAGSYLAACTFYCAIFHETPVGLDFDAGLNPEYALYLQTVAEETVLANIELWNIDTTSVKCDFTYEIDNATVSFTNLSLNADLYFWDFGNGDTDTVANPEYTYEVTGSYDVKLTSSAGCNADSLIKTVEIITTSILENSETNALFPNPGNGIINIKTYENRSDALLSIYTSKGELLKEVYSVNECGFLEFDSSELRAGIYIIEVKIKGSKTETYTFVKN